MPSVTKSSYLRAVSPAGDGWRAHATFLRQAYSASTSASTTAGQTPSFGDTQSVISYSSDGSERWSEGAIGSRSTAMRELRERIQRERQQLQDLENQLAHRKPIPTQSQSTKVPLAAHDSLGTRRLSPSRLPCQRRSQMLRGTLCQLLITFRYIPGSRRML